MGDVRPNVMLERLRIEVDIGAMELSLKRSAFRRAEIADELARIIENEEATRRNIAALRDKLTSVGGGGDHE